MPGQKNVHGIQPNVSAYNNGVPPPPYGGKVQEAGAQVQKTGNRAQKQLIWQSKKNPWVQHKYMQVQKKYPHRVQKTHKQVHHIFCDPRSKKNSG